MVYACYPFAAVSNGFLTEMVVLDEPTKARLSASGKFEYDMLSLIRSFFTVDLFFQCLVFYNLKKTRRVNCLHLCVASRMLHTCRTCQLSSSIRVI